MSGRTFMRLPPQVTPGDMVWQFVTGTIGGATIPPANLLFDHWGLSTGWRSWPANAAYLLAFLGIFAVLNRPVYRRRKAQGRPSLPVVLADIGADGAGTFAGFWLVTGLMTLGTGGLA